MSEKNTVTVELPAELFGDGAHAQRIKPLRMRVVVEIGVLQQQRNVAAINELCVVLARCWPNWHVVDPESGAPLADPATDPMVLLELEAEQFQWLQGEGLVARPTLRPVSKRKS